MFEIIKDGTKINFLGLWRTFFAISGVLVVIALAMIFIRGFNYGIDFAGGTVIQAKFAEAPNLGDIRQSMGSLELGDVVVQNFGDEKEVLIRVEESTSEDLDQVAKDIQQQLFTDFTGNEVIIERVEQVGPQVGSELKRKASLAVLYALAGVLVYIAFRFELFFAVGAVLALFHDVLITLGILSLLGKEINLPIIAAVLTIVGYSLNDTIVVFDRIREKLKADTGDNLLGLMNRSINETLSRTILTSGTTLLAVGSLYLFGGAVINGFAFALLIGIVVGTYSSIGIASSFVFAMKRKRSS